MRRVSISQLSTMRWSFDQDVIRYASLGFDSIGIWRQKIDEYGEHAAIELLQQHHLHVTNVHWAGAFTGCDGKSHVAAIDDAIDAIQQTRRLNADCLIVHSGSQSGHTTSHAIRLFTSALDELVPVARDFEVKLAIEPMRDQHGRGWTFLNSMFDALDLSTCYSSQDVGLVLDLYHFGISRRTFANLDQLIDRIALVQLSDRAATRCANELRRPLGTGVVALDQWLRRLQRLGYAGDYEIELHGPGMTSWDYFEVLDGCFDFVNGPSVAPLLTDSPRPMEPFPLRRRFGQK